MTGVGTHLGCSFPNNAKKKKKSAHSNEGNYIPLSLTIPKLIFPFHPHTYPQNISPASAPFASEDGSLGMGEPGWLCCHRWTGSTPLLTFSPSSTSTRSLRSSARSSSRAVFCREVVGGGHDLRHLMISLPFLQQMISRLCLAGCEQKDLVKQLRQHQSTYRKKAWSCV